MLCRHLDHVRLHHDTGTDIDMGVGQAAAPPGSVPVEDSLLEVSVSSEKNGLSHTEAQTHLVPPTSPTPSPLIPPNTSVVTGVTRGPAQVTMHPQT